VLDLELSGPVESLTGLDRYVGVEAVVRNRGVPVGRLSLPVENGQVSAERVRQALGPGLFRAAAAEGPAPAALPSVTIAVCTRDRPEDLGRCLDALERLDGVELLVVDNAPSNAAAERLVRERHPQVRYMREPSPGLSHARNRALAEAGGEVVAFTDDDVVVDAGWARTIAIAFADDAQVMAVTGLVVPWEMETEAQVLFERYRSFARGFEPVRVQVDPDGRPVAWRRGNVGRLGTGANMAFRRVVFDRVGRFDPALGPGTRARGGDDLDMLFRLVKAGAALRYEPRALVRHRHRRGLPELRAQMHDTGVGFSASLVRAARAYPEERAAITRLWGWWAAKLLYRSVRPSGAPATLLRWLARAELDGVLTGLTRYRDAEPAPLPASGALTPA
jgi:GT2 family glycosyltransferase